VEKLKEQRGDREESNAVLSLFNKASNPADNADNAAIAWLAVSNLPFTTLECPALHALFEAARNVPCSWTLPSCKRAAGPLLARTLKDYESKRDDLFKGIGVGGATLASHSVKKCDPKPRATGLPHRCKCQMAGVRESIISCASLALRLAQGQLMHISCMQFYPNHTSR